MQALHFSHKPRESRTLWLLEELGSDYELNRMGFHPKDLKSDEHSERNPPGRVLALALENGDVSIFESGVIADYIVGRRDATVREQTQRVPRPWQRKYGRAQAVQAAAG